MRVLAVRSLLGFIIEMIRSLVAGGTPGWRVPERPKGAYHGITRSLRHIRRSEQQFYRSIMLHKRKKIASLSLELRSQQNADRSVMGIIILSMHVACIASVGEMG